MFLVISCDDGSICTADELDDDLMMEAMDGDCHLVKFDDGAFKQLDTDTGAWTSVEGD
jgi:hypothetical protein